jgi:hypothetical protein
MKIFFGKIKPTADNKQINETYYETLSPMKLGDIQEGDYAYIISGRNVHLWKAKERLDLDGSVRMNFELIEKDLPISSQKFIAFKYFQLDSSLIVLTTRQSPKAFYPISLSDSSFTEEMLKNRKVYEHEENYRKIKIFSSENQIESGSIDIQLYFSSEKKLNIVKAPFFDQNLFSNFIDNLSKIGNGRIRKDNALIKIKEGIKKSITYPYQELSILGMYDALFNEYGNSDTDILDSDPEFNSENENIIQSFELKSYNQIFYGPPGTGKTYLVRKNFCLEEEINENKSNLIKLNSNRNFWHLAPGRNAYLWDELKQSNVLGYEWVDKSWGDLKELTPKHIEEEGWGNYQLVSYLREVKHGDYICVISGKKFLGIAEVLKDYDYNQAIINNFGFQTVPVKWLKQFDRPIYLNSSQTKTFVRLNYGTRWSTLLNVLRENGFYFGDEEITENKLVKSRNFSFITFHQSFSYEDFIEGIKPILVDSDTENSESIQYEIVQGVFYQACEKAVQLAGYETLQDCLADNPLSRSRKLKSAQEYYLIIDELNRGNVASIFGELITLIEDDKRLGTNSEIIITLPYSKNQFSIPVNLRLVGTMNTADRSIEALDTALRRRFSFEEIMPNPDLLPVDINGLNINLRALLSSINNRLEKLLNRDYTIGHAFFMKVEKVNDLKKIFANKIIPLLQEFFYGDYAKIGLVIGMSFLEVKSNKTTFMKVDLYDSFDIEDKIVYSLHNIEKMTDEIFLNAIRNIYE